MEVNLQGKDSVTVINAYAPTPIADNEKVEQFYDDIERAMANSDSKYKIIIGDFNATNWNQNKRRRLQKHGSIWNRGREMKEEIS